MYGLGMTQMTQGYQLDHSLLIRLFKSVLDNVLLDHGELLHNFLPLAVHLPDTQGHAGLVSETCTPPLKVIRQACKISLFVFVSCWAWTSDQGLGLGLLNFNDQSKSTILICLKSVCFVDWE